MPEPNPYPFLSISSIKIMIAPAPISWKIMKKMVRGDKSAATPYVPMRIATAASPKQKIIAKIPSSPSASF